MYRDEALKKTKHKKTTKKMQNITTINTSLILILFSLLFISCGNNKQANNEVSKMENHESHDNHESSMHQDHDGTMLDEEVGSGHSHETTSVTALLDGYLAVKNALVSDDSKKAATAAEGLASAVIGFDNAQIADANKSEIRDILELMQEHAEHITKSDIEHQRDHFADLGGNLAELVAITGTDRTLYKQYCPMFENNKGGSWLSANVEVMNPLFGSMMLNCGSVQETIAVKGS
jgi:hypothetical protein